MTSFAVGCYIRSWKRLPRGPPPALNPARTPPGLAPGSRVRPRSEAVPPRVSAGRRRGPEGPPVPALCTQAPASALTSTPSPRPSLCRAARDCSGAVAVRRLLWGDVLRFRESQRRRLGLLPLPARAPPRASVFRGAAGVYLSPGSLLRVAFHPPRPRFVCVSENTLGRFKTARGHDSNTQSTDL